MEDHQFRYVTCKNEACGRTIWLPRSSQPGKSPNPSLSPNDYSFGIFACPECGHVSEYKVSESQPGQTRAQDLNYLEALYAALLEFDCDTGVCKSRTIIQKPTTKPFENLELVSESDAWVLHEIHCPKGHPCNRLPHKSKRFSNRYVLVASET